MEYPEFEPEVKTPERRVQLFHKLQNVVAPNVFGRRNVLFDKTDLVFSFGLLQLTEGSTSNGQVENCSLYRILSDAFSSMWILIRRTVRPRIPIVAAKSSESVSV